MRVYLSENSGSQLVCALGFSLEAGCPGFSAGQESMCTVKDGAPDVLIT